MIEIVGLAKSFGAKRALIGVDLSVADGEFVTLVGPNGAGKTTLVRIIATLSRATSGRVRVAGTDVSTDAEAVRRRIGLVSHRTLLYDDLSGEENLLFFGRMYGVPHLRQRIDAVLDRVELRDRRRDPVRTYSRGMQQRLAIARAILHEPSLMLLDEPYTGLDPHATTILRGLLESLACQGQTVLMTTHDLAVGRESANRVAILAGGRIVFQSDTRALDDAAFRAAFHEHTAGAAA